MVREPELAVEREGIAPEDAGRASVYRLLSALLSAPPTAEVIGECAQLSGDDSEIGRGFNTLAAVSRRINPGNVDREYHDLFIGMGRGELVPYESYYLTGFLQEKPLAKLRQDMNELGLERTEGTSEPEDHISSVLEIMAGLVDGSFTDGLPDDARQKAFFDTHIASWAPVFFRDLEAAKASVFFAPVGSLGKAFLSIEQQGFAMA